MSRLIRRFVRWLLPPDVVAIDRQAILGASYDPVNLGMVLNMSDREHRDLLDGVDRLDRKLLAVITGGGVYAAILVSVRDTIPVIATTFAGLLALSGIGLAYAGWRSHPLLTVSSSNFIDAIRQHPDDLRRLAIVAGIEANQEILRFVILKSRMFRWSWACFSVGALSTMIYTVLGGLL